MQVEYFNDDYLEQLDIIAYDNTILEPEAIIRQERLKLRYCACPQCMNELAKKVYLGRLEDKNMVKLKGICIALDHIYLQWLAKGKESVLFMSCPHYNDGYRRIMNCYYLKGHAEIFLGSSIRRNINDYNNVSVYICISERAKRKLIKNHL